MAIDSDALIAEYVEPNPHRAGVAEARLRDSAQPIWALIAYWRAAGEDAQRVADDYRIPLRAVEAAIAYYHRHRAPIDERIAANSA
jgi:uncharacterized protein (DUF433 family)